MKYKGDEGSVSKQMQKRNKEQTNNKERPGSF